MQAPPTAQGSPASEKGPVGGGGVTDTLQVDGVGMKAGRDLENRGTCNEKERAGTTTDET